MKALLGKKLRSVTPKKLTKFRDSRNWEYIKDAESEENRRARGKKVTRYFIDSHTNDDTIVAFAHAGIIQQIICAILESPRLWGLSARNTALYEFSINVEEWDSQTRNY
ncbi:MAG: hypothetical protein CM1200mP3_07170 [Chloroflexota bacterium]|nr:MAG: hypothetical protein CM1200mP3_07170 [Chloroflexota bacterium]